MMQPMVFISYSRADEAEVRQLHRDMTAAGINCWLDVEAIPPGSDWDAELQKAIEQCTHLIIVCTPTSMASSNVRAEWHYAFELKKTLHPLILKPCEIPFRLRIFQHVDATEGAYQTAIKKLVDVLPAQKSTQSTEVVEEFVTPANRIDALVKRAVVNWQAFGLLMDSSTFKVIDNARHELSQAGMDDAALQLIFLSARKNGQPLEYWAEQLQTRPNALDLVENVLIDEVSDVFSHSLQDEFQLLTSNRLLAKITEIISLTEDPTKLAILLDAAEKSLLKAAERELDISEIEDVLFQRFMQSPHIVTARALSWLNSTRLLEHALNQLDAKPLTRGSEENISLYRSALAYMTRPEAVDHLRSRTPDGFAFVPAGWFIMGGGNESDSVLAPAHGVFVPSFWLGITPVTIGEYRQFEAMPGEAKLPVHNINWLTATAYSKYVSEQRNLPITLPTEAMWEKAASWHPSEKRKLRFPWGDEPDYTRCNSFESGRRAFTPVDLFSPQGDSPYGIADMVGNVWEWTTSIWHPYPYHPRDGRHENKAGSRVMRGSSQDARRGFLNGVTTRIAFEEAYAFENAGFRAAIVLAK